MTNELTLTVLVDSRVGNGGKERVVYHGETKNDGASASLPNETGRVEDVVHEGGARENYPGEEVARAIDRWNFYGTCSCD